MPVRTGLEVKPQWMADRTPVVPREGQIRHAFNAHRDNQTSDFREVFIHRIRTRAQSPSGETIRS
jgi:hypothetical protein